ncbi:MAG: MBL fold metallo-hydrolase [Deltaproteobacteria bacterium]|nr:MBL fold metallo-hydrolase [Deltaproteobacteria bacterium]MCL5276479.1 MBL fold metallo-hydrolase [Deltaproteobacteria bacterium]
MDRRIVYGGHSTVLISMGGANILTDPNLSKRIWAMRRRSEPGLMEEQIGPVNLVLISHGHYDHLDMPTVRRLPRTAVVIVPEGLSEYFTRSGFRDVRVMSWWEQTTVHGTRIVAVPANHFQGRNPLVKSLYQGYVVDGKRQIYFAGDTGWFEGIKEIGDMFRLDLALLPIGAYRPWAVFGHHMTPEDSIKAMQYLGAKAMIPIHWGTFRLSLEPLSEPVTRLRRAAIRAGMQDRVVVLGPGQSLDLA